MLDKRVTLSARFGPDETAGLAMRIRRGIWSPPFRRGATNGLRMASGPGAIYAYFEWAASPARGFRPSRLNRRNRTSRRAPAIDVGNADPISAPQRPDQTNELDRGKRMSTQTADQAMKERRSQRRLGARIEICVNLPDSSHTIVAENQDISWGGAQFMTSDPAIRNAERLTLTFPWRRHQSFCADAEVVRREILADGRIRIGARFCSLSHQSHQRLEKLLGLLAKTEQTDDDAESGAARASVVKTLEILFNEPDEMREMLAQIQDGQLSTTVFGTYRTGQSILFAMAGTRDLPSLRLRARVIGQTPLEIADSGWAELANVDLVFEHSRDDLARFVGSALGKLPEASRWYGQSA
jgi:hypothetical protein